MTLVDGLIVISIFIIFAYVIIIKLNEKENESWKKIKRPIIRWWNSGKEKINIFDKPNEIIPDVWGDTTQIM